MFERGDLEALAAYQGVRPVVSLYLNMDPRLRVTPEAYRARLKGLLKEAIGRAPAEDLAAVEAFFDKEFDWSGRSVVVFSSQGDGFWQVHRFAVPLRSNIHVGSKPFIMPLARLMDTYGSYSVALVDQQAIRMFHFHLGQLVASEKLAGEEVKRLKAGGGGVAGRARGDDRSGRTRETVRGNLNDFADALGAFCARHATEHILLGGPEAAVHQFRGLLSQQWRDCVKGMLAISMRAAESEVLAQSLEVMQANERQRETELVERVITLAGKGANGAIGLKDTLAAVDSGRVQTLLLVEGMLTPDVADPAIAKAVDFGGTVEFVDADSELAKSEGIGALLRY